jgi:hypothetical protein
MSKFGGEEFLDVPLPNYGLASVQMTTVLTVCACLWLWIRRYFLTVDKMKHAAKVLVQALPIMCMLGVAFLGFLVTGVWLLLVLSPHNYFTPRRVFEAPILNKAECDYIITMAHNAANRTFDEWDRKRILDGNDFDDESDILKDPIGWQKKRHNNYPTTDLNLVTDNFSKEDQEWLGDIMDRRLAPTVSRIFSVPTSSIRANDMFVVRYDGGGKRQAFLKKHTDNVHISFNLLLNDDFQGGGTQFWNRNTDQAFAHVHPQRVGQFLVHGSQLEHEGMPVQKGTRYILVGFLAVDNIDPWTGDATGLRWLESWLNASWLHVRLKQSVANAKNKRRGPSSNNNNSNNRHAAFLFDHPWTIQLFEVWQQMLMDLLDKVCSHEVVNLVEESEADNFIEALDKEYYATHENKRTKGNWFKGQQINTDFQGYVYSYWDERYSHDHIFRELIT